MKFLAILFLAIAMAFPAYAERGIVCSTHQITSNTSVKLYMPEPWCHGVDGRPGIGNMDEWDFAASFAGGENPIVKLAGKDYSATFEDLRYYRISDVTIESVTDDRCAPPGICLYTITDQKTGRQRSFSEPMGTKK